MPDLTRVVAVELCVARVPPLAVDAAIAGAPDVVAKVQSGKVQALGALVGAVMKTTRGTADAATVRRMLEERVLSA